MKFPSKEKMYQIAKYASMGYFVYQAGALASQAAYALAQQAKDYFSETENSLISPKNPMDAIYLISSFTLLSLVVKHGIKKGISALFNFWRNPQAPDTPENESELLLPEDDIEKLKELMEILKKIDDHDGNEFSFDAKHIKIKFTPPPSNLVNHPHEQKRTRRSTFRYTPGDTTCESSILSRNKF